MAAVRLLPMLEELQTLRNALNVRGVGQKKGFKAFSQVKILLHSAAVTKYTLGPPDCCVYGSKASYRLVAPPDSCPSPWISVVSEVAGITMTSSFTSVGE